MSVIVVWQRKLCCVGGVVSVQSCEGIRRSNAGRWPLMRQRQASGASVSIIAAYAAALSLTAPSFAKTPGEVHCYNGICHRVKSVDEMKLLVGMDREEITSFYDSAERDSMNVGTITSSGEEFDADSDSHAASSLYPDGTELLIWNPKNQQTAHIRVNDFGPFYMLRTIDVTRGVAEKLEFSKTGVARLRVSVVWAPSPEAARFRRHRTYPTVEGYLGRLDLDQLFALKQRLIASGPARNGVPPLVTADAKALAPAQYRIEFLPAYTGGPNGPQFIRNRAGLLNMPRLALTAAAPGVIIAEASTKRGVVTSARPTRTLGSASAMAAASQPAASIVTARDTDVTTAVASLTTTAPAIGEAATSAMGSRSSDPTHVSTREAQSSRQWTPNTLAWQQLLVALGILSLGAVSWRTRSPTGHFKRQRVQALDPIAYLPATSRPTNTPSLFPSVPLEAEPVCETAPHAPLLDQPVPDPTAFEPIDNVIALPLLPRRPSTKTMEEWREEAAGHMEAYAFGLAESAYRHLLAARERALGPVDPMTASAERLLADCLREQGRYSAAEPHYRRALSTMALAAGETHPATADILDEYAICLLKQGCGAEAERTANQALSIRRATVPSSREFALTLSIVAETLRCQGQLPAAEQAHRQAWSHVIAVSGQDSLDAAASMTSIGTVLAELGRFGPAEELLNAGTKTLTAICGPDHPASAMGYALLGDLYRRAGALDAARTMQSHALGIRERTLGERHPDTIENVLTLSLIATEQYRTDEARALLDRALNALNATERSHLGPQSRVRSLLVALSHQHDTTTPMALAAE
jgi:tetratricopeptide (TPR) repeat protein